jgi:hypothetical protein
MEKNLIETNPNVLEKSLHMLLAFSKLGGVLDLAATLKNSVEKGKVLISFYPTKESRAQVNAVGFTDGCVRDHQRRNPPVKVLGTDTGLFKFQIPEEFSLRFVDFECSFDQLRS